MPHVHAEVETHDDVGDDRFDDRWMVPRLFPDTHIPPTMTAEIKFKHPQPFTWAQVMDLDVGTISQGKYAAKNGYYLRAPPADRPRNHSPPALS